MSDAANTHQGFNPKTSLAMVTKGLRKVIPVLQAFAEDNLTETQVRARD